MDNNMCINCNSDPNSTDTRIFYIKTKKLSRAEAKKRLKEIIQRYNPDTVARYSDKSMIDKAKSYFREINIIKLFFGANNEQV